MTKEQKQYSRAKIVFSETNGAGTVGHPHVKKINPDKTVHSPQKLTQNGS